MQIWCTYALAWTGRNAVVETLSKTIAAEVIGVVTVYSVKALLENLSKGNSWPDAGGGQDA